MIHHLDKTITRQETYISEVVLKPFPPYCSGIFANQAQDKLNASEIPDFEREALGEVLKPLLEKGIYGRKGQAECVGNAFIGDLSVNYIGAPSDFRVLPHGLLPPLVGNFQGIGERGV